jgi:hypothetical protein
VRRKVGRRCPLPTPMRGGGQVEEGGFHPFSPDGSRASELLRVCFRNLHIFFLGRCLLCRGQIQIGDEKSLESGLCSGMGKRS